MLQDFKNHAVRFARKVSTAVASTTEVFDVMFAGTSPFRSVSTL